MRHELGALLPSIKVPPPGPISRELAARLTRYEAPTSSTISAGQIPVFWEEGKGANIVDPDGNIYVDMSAGYTVAVAGHSNPRIVAALSQQANKLMHTQGASNPNSMRVRLAEKLAQITPGPLTVSHISSTGAEAIELAFKTARLYTGRTGMIAFHHGFHGKTLGALSLTSRNYYREPFLPLIPGVTHLPFAYCYRCPFGHQLPTCQIFCAKYVQYTLDDPDSAVADVAAIILEPIQGHGGWIVPPKEFVQAIRRICTQHGILMIADEIITGFGRTGQWFAVNHYDVVPDILVIGKGMASGFPISAIVTRPEIAQAWKPLQHISTFLGNPVGCAATLACIEEIEERGLVQRSAELGARLLEALTQMQPRHPLMGDVRGKGLMVGVELVRDRATKEVAEKETAQVVAAALSRGIVVNQGGAYGNVLKMSPPLVITQEQLDAAIRLLDESLAQVEARM